jgi:formylmethanofuran dehydrogenase subunit C
MITRSAILICTGLFTVTISAAQEWTGAVNNDWNNPANWNDWPLDDENVTIDPSFYTGAQASPVIASNSVFIPDRLFVQNGAVLTIQAGLAVDNRSIIADDAQIVMTGGTFSTGRLIAEGGGLFHLTGGTANALGVLALGDDGTQPSRMIQDGGTLNVTGEFGFDVELAPSAPRFILNNGSLVVNGDAEWFGEAPGSGRGYFIVNGGTAQINGSFLNSPAGTLEMHVEITGGSLTINGPLVDLVHAADSLKMTGGELRLEGDLILRNGGSVRAYAGEVVVMGNTELRGTGNYIFHHLTIAGGALLEHTQPMQIMVNGHWTQAGVFEPNTNAVAFAGMAPQQVDASRFHIVRMMSAGGIQLNGPVDVSGHLIMENGIIQTSGTAMLTMLPGAISTSGSPASHVNGPMRKIGDQDFVFPVGNGWTWRRIGILDINGSDAEFTVQYFSGSYQNTSSLGMYMVEVSGMEHWTVQRGDPGDQARITLHWEDADIAGLTGCEGVVVAYWDGSAWQGQPGGTTGACEGPGAGSVTTDEALPIYEAVTLGIADPTVNVSEFHRPAPPELLYDATRNELLLRNAGNPCALWIYDSRGALVMQRNIRGEGVQQLPVLSTGVYNARLHTQEKVLHLKFLMQASE